jgi:predicted AAA+ superfamily ATPase
MILRSSYIEALKPFIGKDQIKIITGIRRSGKSTVLSGKMFQVLKPLNPEQMNPEQITLPLRSLRILCVRCGKQKNLDFRF